MPGAYIRSLPNGTHIGGDTSTAGRGQLTIVNGTSNDACVILMDSAKSVRVRMIYIRANSSATLRRLTAGSYRALFTLGSDWDQKERMFTRNAEYFDFGKELSFEETRDSRAIHYSVETITLQETPNGNAHSIGIPEGEFAASSRR